MLRKKTVRWTVFADVATSVSEAIGVLRRKIPITCSKIEVTPLGVTSIFLVLMGIEQGRSNIYVAEENSPVDCFR